MPTNQRAKGRQATNVGSARDCLNSPLQRWSLLTNRLIEPLQTIVYYYINVTSDDVKEKYAGVKLWRDGSNKRARRRGFLFYFIFLRKDTCPPNHINVTNNWSEEKEVRTGVGKD